MCCHVIKRLAWGQFICIREQITKEKWMELRETLLAFRHKYFVYILGCTFFFLHDSFLVKSSLDTFASIFSQEIQFDLKNLHNLLFTVYVVIERLPEIR